MPPPDRRTLLSRYAVLESGAVERLIASLHPGELVKGRVLDVLAPSTFVLRLRGLNLVARSDLLLTTGSELYAQVSQVTPRLILKLIPGSDGRKRLHSAIRALGAKESRLTARLVEKMLEAGQPVTPGSVKEVADAWKRWRSSYPDLTCEEGLTALLWLRARRMPTDAASIDLAALFLRLPPGVPAQPLSFTVDNLERGLERCREAMVRATDGTGRLGRILAFALNELAEDSVAIAWMRADNTQQWEVDFRVAIGQEQRFDAYFTASPPRLIGAIVTECKIAEKAVADCLHLLRGRLLRAGFDDIQLTSRFCHFLSSPIPHRVNRVA